MKVNDKADFKRKYNQLKNIVTTVALKNKNKQKIQKIVSKGFSTKISIEKGSNKLDLMNIINNTNNDEKTQIDDINSLVNAVISSE